MATFSLIDMEAGMDGSEDTDDDEALHHNAFDADQFFTVPDSDSDGFLDDEPTSEDCYSHPAFGSTTPPWRLSANSASQHCS